MRDGTPLRAVRNVKIADRSVGPGEPVFVIAEAGVAHFGSVQTAYALVDMAMRAGADAVKFQVFKTDSLVSEESPQWRSRLRPKELPYSAFEDIKRYCDRQGILFLATAHEEESADFLDALGVAAFKIGSGEVENLPFYRHVAKKGRPLIVSTGLHDLDAIGEIAEICRAAGNDDLVLLHCNTAYPTPPAESQLLAMRVLSDRFRVPVGYSDHTIGNNVSLAAVALGAQVLEKHICLDKSVTDSQDCRVACDEADLVALVRGVREIEAAVGDGRKAVCPSAQASIAWARKSLVLKEDRKAGAVVRLDDLIAKRPGDGISPKEIHQVVGKRLRADVQRDRLLRWEDLE